MIKKRNGILLSVLALLVLLLAAFFAAYRFVGVGGKILKIKADGGKGFYSEYYLFLPDTLKKSDPVFLLVEPNNTGFTDDNHKTHVDAAHDIVRFGQSNKIARELGIPVLVPCFDRTQTNWEDYTHALDRDTLLIEDGPLKRVDEQLLAMVADARGVLVKKGVQIQEKILLNGFSASGSFVNRFTALHPEKVAATAAGGVNSMVILPAVSIGDQTLIYPVGIADVEEITGAAFQPQAFAAVPQYYYMGAEDDNDALPYDDAYSDMEREIVIKVLDEEMDARWESCQNVYKEQNIRAGFHSYPGIGHETTTETIGDIASFFTRVMEGYK